MPDSDRDRKLRLPNSPYAAGQLLFILYCTVQYRQIGLRQKTSSWQAEILELTQLIKSAMVADLDNGLAAQAI